MGKKILIISGHPDAASFNNALAEAYKQGALESGAEVKEVAIRDMTFNPNLPFGYHKEMELEPDLVDARQKINWADHLVWFFPVWWGGMPAMLKGFVDRVFLPGFAFQTREGSRWWDRLLKGKSARIVCTLDQPSWYYRFVYRQPSTHQLKRVVLHFSGVRPVKITYIGPVTPSKPDDKKRWLKKVRQLGLVNK